MATAELWDVEQLAGRLGVSSWRAYLLGRTSLLHARVQLGTRQLKWRPDAVERWIADGGDAAAHGPHQPAGAA